MIKKGEINKHKETFVFSSYDGLNVNISIRNCSNKIRKDINLQKFPNSGVYCLLSDGKPLFLSHEESALMNRMKDRPSVPLKQVNNARNNQQTSFQTQGFFNKYTFFDCCHIPSYKAGYNGELRKNSPHSGIHRLEDDQLRGEIRVRLTLKSPLLLPSVVSQENGHSVFQTYIYKNVPVLLPSTIKGMLSSYFEALTYSRIRVFSHREPLGRRKRVKSGASVVPVQIVSTDPERGKLEIKVFKGCGDNNVQDAAWLDWDLALKVPHGSRVEFSASLVQKGGRFKYWKVVRIVYGDKVYSIKKEHLGRDHKYLNHPEYSGSGIVHRSGLLIENKHDERVFFGESDTREVDENQSIRVRERYRLLVKDYQQKHERDEARTESSKTGKGLLVWNHVIGIGKSDQEKRELQKLKKDQLLFGTFENSVLVDLSPVMISRIVDDESPFDKLPDHLKPAAEPSEMTIADRVFGWSPFNSSKSKTPCRSKIRIVDVRSVTSQITPLGDKGITFSCLSSPKPSADSFYRINGIPRGRKFFRPQSGSWDLEVVRERFKSEIPSKVNFTFRDWVETDSTFEYTIRFECLTKVELASLVTLVNASENSDKFFTLGYAKPHGFGVVQSEIIASESYAITGSELKEIYSKFDESIVHTSLDVCKWQKIFYEEFDSAFQNSSTLLDQFNALLKTIPLEETIYPDLNWYGWKGTKGREVVHLPGSNEPSKRLKFYS
jgi:CRISPR-associated protein (TIGR03986 family)